MSALQRLDDWLNPVAVKELRQAVRGKFVMVALILSLLAELVAVAAITIMSSLNDRQMDMVGPNTFTVLFSVVFTAAIFFIPLYSGFRMAAERSDVNVDLLFITTIRPRTIVLGKVIAVTGLVGLLFSASLPFLMFSYVLRGVDFTAVMFIIATAMVLVISQSILALFIGSLPVSRPFKILLALGFFLGTFGVHVPMLAFTSEMVRSGGAAISAFAPRFWSGAVATFAAIVAVDAILLVLMTAVITPASANRALPIRIMFTAVWLLSGGTAAWAFISMRSYEVMLAWAVVQIGLITLILLSATSERESWGPRVTRTIPENPLLRAVAFLFYSGAAGGTLWAIVMYALTVVVYRLMAFTLRGTLPRWTDLTQYLIDGALVMLGYAMTAVLLRRKWLRRVPQNRTWGLVLAMFVALTILPPLAIITGDAETVSWEMRVHITTLLNPFPTVRSAPLRDQRTVLLAIWALGMTAANASWFIGQMRRFGVRHPVPPLPAVLQEASE